MLYAFSHLGRTTVDTSITTSFLLEAIRQITLVSTLLAGIAGGSAVQMGTMDKAGRKWPLIFGISGFAIAALLAVAIMMISMAASVWLAPTTVLPEAVQELNVDKLGQVIGGLGLLLLVGLCCFVVGIVALGFAFSRWLGLSFCIAVVIICLIAHPIFLAALDVWR
jgi:MFS family permease